jgi:hypothetical protein
VLNDYRKSECKKNAPDHKLADPYAVVLHGRTCQDAKDEFLKRRDDYVEKSTGSGIPRIRALFEDENIENAAKNLSALLTAVAIYESHECGRGAFGRANNALDHLIEQLVRDVNGETTTPHSIDIDISSLNGKCSGETLCEAVGTYQNERIKCPAALE